MTLEGGTRRAVFFVDFRPLPRTNDCVVYKLDQSGKACIQQTVQRINWSPLYCLQNPDDMVTMFNSTVNQIIDQFMVGPTTCNTTTLSCSVYYFISHGVCLSICLCVFTSFFLLLLFIDLRGLN